MRTLVEYILQRAKEQNALREATMAQRRRQKMDEEERAEETMMWPIMIADDPDNRGGLCRQISKTASEKS